MTGIADHQASGDLLSGRQVQAEQERDVAAHGAPLEESGPAGSDADGGRKELCVGKGEVRILRSPREIPVANRDDEVRCVPQDDVPPVTPGRS